MTHPSNKPVEQTEIQHDYMNQKPEASHLRLYFKKRSESVELTTPTKSGVLKRNDSDASSKKSVDDELLEIINDFKNNVFTISEVEELVASWKNRNDVKKSFKEKQEQLQNMREEYEKIQQKMKDKLKRPSPFERMKRIFTKKQEKPANNISPLNLTGDRLNSTLSLHSASSNSSSGRMSTSSQTSVCDRDSGTHSDHEEKNHRVMIKKGQPENLMENYLVPPSNPRRVEDNRSLLSFSISHNSSKTVTPSPPDLSDHYIIFPSNVPIFSPPQQRKGSEGFSTFKGKN